MTSTGKISSAQLYCILFACRIVALFTYISPEKITSQSANSILTAITFVVLQLLFSIPVFLVINHDNSKGIIGNAKMSSSLFAKITAIIYCAAFIYAAGLSVSRFELFVSSVMFPGAEILLFIVLLMAISLFGVFKGLETLGRSAVIIIFAVSISTVFIGLTVAKNFDYTNLYPIFSSSVSAVSNSAFYSATRTMELVSLMIIAPHINGKLKNGFAKWIIVFGMVAATLFTGIQGILGAYGERQMFQLYALTLIAKFSIFERLDDLLTGVWVLCTLIKISFYCFVAVKCLEQGFEKRANRLIQTGVCASVFGVYLLTSSTVLTFSSVIASPINSILYLLITILVPLCVFFSKKLLKQKQKKNGEPV